LKEFHLGLLRFASFNPLRLSSILFYDFFLLKPAKIINFANFGGRASIFIQENCGKVVHNFSMLIHSKELLGIGTAPLFGPQYYFLSLERLLRVPGKFAAAKPFL
jgi:hypothetical protein